MHMVVLGNFANVGAVFWSVPMNECQDSLLEVRLPLDDAILRVHLGVHLDAFS